MAKAVTNPALTLSGRIDGFVYRKTRDGLVVSRRPVIETKPRGGKKVSEAQAEQQSKFAFANNYSRRILADPLHRRVYERLARERNRRVDRMIVSDYLTPPEIEHVELSGYLGQAGGKIRVLAFDDVEVVSVEVQIHTAAGALLEHGAAKCEHGVWNYTTTAAAGANDFLVITITAADRPGNRTTKKVMFP